jgi:hypothetical protein
MDSGDAVTAELYQNMNVYLMLTVLSGNVILMQIVRTVEFTYSYFNCRRMKFFTKLLKTSLLH